MMATNSIALLANMDSHLTFLAVSACVEEFRSAILLRKPVTTKAVKLVVTLYLFAYSATQELMDMIMHVLIVQKGWGLLEGNACVDCINLIIVNKTIIFVWMISAANAQQW